MSKIRQRRRDEEVDKIRSIFWYHWIGDRIGCLQPSEVRKVLEPFKSQRNALGEPDKNGKFSFYMQGKRMPNSTLIEQAERIVPGSSMAIHHPLWKVLRQQAMTEEDFKYLLGNIDGKVQNLVLMRDGSIRTTPSELYLQSLIKIGTIDALVGLTIVLRLNIERGKIDEAWEFSNAVFKLLVILWPVFINYAIERLLYDIYDQRLFRLTASAGYKRGWNVYSFDRMPAYLYAWALNARAKMSKPRRLDHFVALAIEGKLEGQDGECFPLLIPDLAIGPPTEKGSDLLKFYLGVAARTGMPPVI